MNTTIAYPESPGYKTEHPETSKGAARAVHGAAATLRARVDALFDTGELTADEAAGALGESVLSVRPRVTELCRQGRLEDAGQRRRNASGHRAAVWRRARHYQQEEMFA